MDGRRNGKFFRRGAEGGKSSKDGHNDLGEQAGVNGENMERKKDEIPDIASSNRRMIVGVKELL